MSRLRRFVYRFLYIISRFDIGGRLQLHNTLNFQNTMEEMHQPPQVGPNMMASVGGVPNHSNNVNRRNRVRVTLHAMMLEKLPLHEAARLEMKSLPSKTPVSVLQELLSRRGTIPKYELVQIEGAIHEPTFRYRVTVADVVGLYNSLRIRSHG